MRSLTESLRRMKSAEDRAEYSKIERIRGAVAGKAGASPAAQAAVIRLNEEAEAANDRIAASELKGDFQQLVLDFTAINSRDHDQTLTDKSKELETLKGVRSNQKLAQDKSLARAEAHAEKERDQAKDRVARDKKHYVADSYQKLAGGIGRILILDGLYRFVLLIFCSSCWIFGTKFRKLRFHRCNRFVNVL